MLNLIKKHLIKQVMKDLRESQETLDAIIENLQEEVSDIDALPEVQAQIYQTLIKLSNHLNEANDVAKKLSIYVER